MVRDNYDETQPAQGQRDGGGGEKGPKKKKKR